MGGAGVLLSIVPTTLLRRSSVWLLALLLAVPAATPGRAGEADDLYRFATGNYANKRWKHAIEEFREFLDKYPDDARADKAAFYLGDTLFQSENYVEAATYFHQYLTRKPNGPLARSALFRAGVAEYLAKKFAPAEADLEPFLTAYPDDKSNAYTLPYLGKIAMQRGDSAAAEKYFRVGLQGFPRGDMEDDCRFEQSPFTDPVD